MICLKLLRDITARGQISDTKKMFQSLAAACLSVLEKSDNIVLLTTVMGFVKDWLLKEPPLPTSPSLSDQVRRVSFGVFFLSLFCLCSGDLISFELDCRTFVVLD